MIDLRTAESFGVLAGSTVTNTGKSTIKGYVGVCPGSAITGFPPGTASAMHADDTAEDAKQDAMLARNAGGNAPATKDMSGLDLGGKTLAPGVYTFSSSVGLTGTLTLDGAGDYVFRIGSTLVTASASKMVLKNGANGKNIFFLVGSSATLGTTTLLHGTIIASESITLMTGARCGRAVAQNGAVTLDSAIVGD
jgi:hypothetical protein